MRRSTCGRCRPPSSRDPALSAKVMRTCRSAYFGFQGNMMSQAVAFLGANVIRKVVQSAVIHNAFSDAKETSATAALSMNDLWKHSLATGMAMEIIGKADKKKTPSCWEHYTISARRRSNFASPTTMQKYWTWWRARTSPSSSRNTNCSASRTPTAAVSWLSTGTCPAKFVPPSPRTTSPAVYPAPTIGCHGAYLRHRRAHDGDRLRR